MREEIIRATKILESGGTILYPTDTIWGLGCDATNYRAVQKIYKIKKRVTRKSFIIILDQPEKILKYVEYVPEIVWDLINSVDTPLTIVYPRAKNLAKNVIAPDKSVAIRIVRDQFCVRMINLFNKPVISTSANLANEVPPLIFSNISKEIIDGVDGVVNVNRDRLNILKPSTIIKLNEDGGYVVLRS